MQTIYKKDNLIISLEKLWEYIYPSISWKDTKFERINIIFDILINWKLKKASTYICYWDLQSINDYLWYKRCDIPIEETKNKEILDYSNVNIIRDFLLDLGYVDRRFNLSHLIDEGLNPRV